MELPGHKQDYKSFIWNQRDKVNDRKRFCTEWIKVGNYKSTDQNTFAT